MKLTVTTARVRIPHECQKPSEIRSLFWGARKCTNTDSIISEAQTNSSIQVDSFCKEFLVKKEKEDERVLFSNDLLDDPYIVGARSLRAGLPPLDLATIKDFMRFYTPFCKTLGGSVRLAAAPAIFCLTHRQMRAEGIFDI